MRSANDQLRLRSNEVEVGILDFGWLRLQGDGNVGMLSPSNEGFKPLVGRKSRLNRSEIEAAQSQ